MKAASCQTHQQQLESATKESTQRASPQMRSTTRTHNDKHSTESTDAGPDSFCWRAFWQLPGAADAAHAAPRRSQPAGASSPPAVCVQNTCPFVSQKRHPEMLSFSRTHPLSQRVGAQRPRIKTLGVFWGRKRVSAWSLSPCHHMAQRLYHQRHRCQGQPEDVASACAVVART